MHLFRLEDDRLAPRLDELLVQQTFDDARVAQRTLAGTNAAASTNTTTPLVSAARDILTYATTLSDYFAAHDLAPPSFDLEGLEDYSNALPDDIHETRAKLRGAVADMSHLAAGPKEDLMSMAWAYHDVSLLQFVHHFSIAEAVPLFGSISIDEVAAVTSTSPSRLKRILRCLALHRVFAEPETGRIAHTPASRQLVTSDLVRSWVAVRTEETGPAAFGMVAAAERWGADAQELDQTPYSLVHSDGELSRFELLSRPENKHREIRFAQLMKALQSTEAYDLKHTVNGYAWRGLGDQALVIDVGGSTGATAQALVSAFPHLRVVVQDRPSVIAQGRQTLPAHLADSIELMEYDFLTQTQPVQDAAAYCFQHILHDWPDKYAIQALRNTASILRPGQKLIIVDVVMPAPRRALSTVERTLHRSDMEMNNQFNALEREAADWESLIRKADPRLRILSFTQPHGGANTVIEIAVGGEHHL